MANNDFEVRCNGDGERDAECQDFSSPMLVDHPMEPSMSENLILNWTQSLTAADRRALAERLLGRAASPAATILAAYASAQGLSVGELAGLLPGSLFQARLVANHLAAEGIGMARPAC